MAEKISYVTADQVTIVGDWYPTPTMLGAVLLLHMMHSTRTSWAGLQRSLAKVGLASLAIDLRGHGESTQGYKGALLDHRSFSDEEHLTALNDVYYGVEWIKHRGLEPDRVAVCGASFGANLAAKIMATHPSMPCGALLSPGIDLRGLNAFEDIQHLVSDQALYIAASEEDKDSFKAANTIFDSAPVDRKIFTPYKGAGHGTEMFGSDVKLPDKIAEWMAGILRG